MRRNVLSLMTSAIQVAREKSAALLQERIQTVKPELPLIVLWGFQRESRSEQNFHLAKTEGQTNRMLNVSRPRYRLDCFRR